MAKNVLTDLAIAINKQKDIQDELLYSVKTLSYTEVIIILYHLEGISVRQNTAKKRFYGDYKQTNQNSDLKKICRIDNYRKSAYNMS